MEERFLFSLRELKNIDNTAGEGSENSPAL